MYDRVESRMQSRRTQSAWRAWKVVSRWKEQHVNTSEKAQSKPVATLLKMLVLAVCMGVLACVLGACAGSGGNSASDLGGITVSASSETKVVPDKARIGASVVTEAKTAEECQNKTPKQ